MGVLQQTDAAAALLITIHERCEEDEKSSLKAGWSAAFFCCLNNPIAIVVYESSSPVSYYCSTNVVWNEKRRPTITTTKNLGARVLILIAFSIRSLGDVCASVCDFQLVGWQVSTSSVCLSDPVAFLLDFVKELFERRLSCLSDDAGANCGYYWASFTSSSSPDDVFSSYKFPMCQFYRLVSICFFLDSPKILPPPPPHPFDPILFTYILSKKLKFSDSNNLTTLLKQQRHKLWGTKFWAQKMFSFDWLFRWRTNNIF